MAGRTSAARASACCPAATAARLRAAAVGTAPRSPPSLVPRALAALSAAFMGVLIIAASSSATATIWWSRKPLRPRSAAGRRSAHRSSRSRLATVLSPPENSAGASAAKRRPNFPCAAPAMALLSYRLPLCSRKYPRDFPKPYFFRNASRPSSSNSPIAARTAAADKSANAKTFLPLPKGRNRPSQLLKLTSNAGAVGNISKGFPQPVQRKNTLSELSGRRDPPLP